MTQTTSRQVTYRIHPNAWAHLANLCESLGIGRNPLVSSLVIHATDPCVRCAIVDALRQKNPLHGCASSVTVTE